MLVVLVIIFLSIWLFPSQEISFGLFAMKPKSLLTHPIKHPLITQTDSFLFYSQRPKLPIAMVSKRRDKSQQVESFPNFSVQPRASWILSCFSGNQVQLIFKTICVTLHSVMKGCQKCNLKWMFGQLLIYKCT